MDLPRLSPPGSGLDGLAADVAAAAALEQTSTDGLLRAYACLTHRIHETPRGPALDSARAQRDLVRAEVLRRTGDLTTEDRCEGSRHYWPTPLGTCACGALSVHGDPRT